MPRNLYFCSYVDATHGKCIETTGAAPPTGWQNPGFDDSTWTVPVARTSASGDFFHFAVSVPQPASGPQVPVSGSVFKDIASPTLPRVDAFRYKFFLPNIPTGLSILSATLLVNVVETDPNTSGAYARAYINGNNTGIPADTFSTFGPFSVSVPTGYLVPGENLIAIANHWGVPFNGGIQFGLQVEISDVPPDWLVTVEPTAGVTKQGKRLFVSSEAQHMFTLESRKRGSANYTLSVAAGDSYEPTIGQQIWLFDQNKGGFVLAFTGLLQSFKNRQIGTGGDRFVDCVATSLECVFDQIYAQPQQFVNMTCGQIVAALYNAHEALSQVALGTVSDGVTIPLFNTNYEKLSDLFTQLATTSGFVWGVDPVSQELFFCLPGTVAAPLVLTSARAMWDSINWESDGSDYRNRQAVRLNYDAFTHSAEFFVGAGQQSFTLLRPVDQVTNAYVTLSKPNGAFGSFSSNPSLGDTVTVGPYTGTAWQASHVYALDGIIVVNGFVFKVTTAGTSGGTIPTFNPLTGATTTDNTAIWTCQGPLGLGTGQNTYTFCVQNLGYQWAPGHVFSVGNQIFPLAVPGVGTFLQQITTAGTSGSSQPNFATTIGATTTDGSATWTCMGPVFDNTIYGLVLIGSGATDTCTNLVDALNANAAKRGITFSLPTWENSQGNAISQAGSTFTFQQKAAGTGYIASLASTGSAFSWVNGLSPSTTVTQTFGGSSPQGSVGPNEGATISLQVYADGTNTAAPACVYTHGSNVIKLASPLNVGTNLNVEYTRPDGNVIEVENTPLVTALAIVTFGTGEVQQISDQSSQGLVSTNALAGLQLAQQSLAAFDIVPLSIDIEILQPGILPGQLVTLTLSGAMAILNGTYFVQEVSGALVPIWNEGVGMDSLQAPQAGHYRYTLTLIDVAQIGSYLDFWSGMGGGGSGAGGGGSGGGIASGLSATSGGIQSNSAAALVQGGTKLLTGNYTATAADYGLLLSFNLAGSATLTLPALPFVPQFPQWSVHVENTSSSASNLTIGVPIGVTIDGVTGGLLIPPAQGVYLTTDGINYYTERGLNPTALPGAMIQIAQQIVASQTAKITFAAIPGSFNHLLVKYVATASDGIWQASHSYAMGTVLVEFYTATSTYYYWKVTTAGTSGGSIPAFSTHNSGTLTDGSLVWTNSGVDSAAFVDVWMFFNGDFANANYNAGFIAGQSGGSFGTFNPASTAGPLTGSVQTPRGIANYATFVDVDIPGYTLAVFKGAFAKCSQLRGAPGGGTQTTIIETISHASISAISQIDLTLSDGTYFSVGSGFYLYGIN